MIENNKGDIKQKLYILEKVIDYIKKIIPELILAIIVFFIGYFFAKQGKKIFNRIMKKSKVDSTVILFFSQVIFCVIFIIFIIISLGILGVPTTSFVTALGAVGIAIGLALQNNLSNFASGILILVFKPFKIGDFIETSSGILGTVINISTMNTTLNTIDNKKIYLPNSSLTTNYVINYSQNNFRYLIINVKITYESNHNKAIDIIKNILLNNDFIEEKSNIICEISELNPNYVNIFSKAKVLNENYINANYEILKKIKEEFEKNNINFSKTPLISVK